MRRFRFPTTPHVLLMAAILIFAGVLRFWDLFHIPWVIYGDESQVGLQARIVMQTPVPVFSNGYWGIPEGFYYLVSFGMRWFGDSLAGLRAVSAVGGMIAVGICYVVLRLFYPREKEYAVIGSCLMAASAYHIHFSRIGVGQIHDTWLILMCLAAALALVRFQRIWFALLLGIACGITPYFFFGARVIPVIVLAWMVFFFLRTRRNRWRIAGYGCLALGIGLLMFSPMIRLEWNGNGGARGRFSSESIWGIDLSQTLREAEGRTFISNRIKAPFELFFRGNDRGFFFLDYTERPVMGYLAIPFILIGMVSMVVRRKDLAGIVVPWILIAMVANGMFMRSTPHAQRLIVIMPAMIFLMTEGIRTIAIGFQSDIAKRMIAGGLVMVLCVFELHFYFFDFTPNRFDACDLNWQFTTTVSRLLSEKNLEKIDVYFLKHPLGMLYYSADPTIEFMSRKKGIDINTLHEVPEHAVSYLVLAPLYKKDEIATVSGVEMMPVLTRQNNLVGWVLGPGISVW